MPVRLPSLFVAHGSPMNALGRTRYARFLSGWGRALPRPEAVLVVSAHWEERRLQATSAEWPRTIHDFAGFPRVLYELHYPAPGAPGVALRAVERLRAAGHEAEAEPERGLDHGAWAPLLALWPQADVPVAQLSLLATRELSRLLDVGRALEPFRDEGVLVIGSGNLVHNLATADLRREDAPVAAWANGFDRWVKERLDAGDAQALCRPWDARDGVRAHPTIEHYAPLLVALGAAPGRPRVSYPHEGFEHGTLSLRCVRFD